MAASLETRVTLLEESTPTALKLRLRSLTDEELDAEIYEGMVKLGRLPHPNFTIEELKSITPAQSAAWIRELELEIGSDHGVTHVAIGNRAKSQGITPGGMA